MEKEILEKHRTAALNLYDVVINEFKIEPSKSLKSQYANISNNEFKVAVIGNVKAGKSTFINAILEEELMPSDVREATSAIIEIFQSDNKSVSVKYLDGKNEIISDKLPEFLKKIASVSEKYRSLPIAQLNDLLIKNFDINKKESVFTDNDIDELISSTKSIHDLAPEEFSNRIKDYLEDYKNGSNIPLTIRVGFPHKFKIEQFCIVDTPGIETKSGLGEKTKVYVEEADAIIYLHKGSPTDQSLQNTWDNVISEQAKRNTFLVLTHRFGKTIDDNNVLLEETKKTFPYVKQDRIFSVDSLTELALTEFYKNEKDLAVFKTICKQNKAYNKICAEAFLEAEGDINIFQDFLETQSNMCELRKSLIEFSDKALRLQLHGFIEELHKNLEVLERDNLLNLQSFEDKHQDPQSFANKAEEQKSELEFLEVEFKKNSAELREKFDIYDKYCPKNIELEDMFKEFETNINDKTPVSDETSFNSYIEKTCVDIMDCLEDFVIHLKNDLITLINSQEITLTESGKYHVIPKIVLSDIWLDAKKNAYVKITVSREGFFGAIRDFFGKETKTVFSNQRYFSEAKSGIIKKLQMDKQKVKENIHGMVENSTKQYENMMTKKLEERKSFLDDLLQNSKSNDELEEYINITKNFIKQIQDKIKTCTAIEGELA